MSSFNDRIIEEFRANGGKVGGPFEGAQMVLLTTTGAKSGQQRTTPLVYTSDGSRLIIIASAAGADKHPAWFHNLVANPRVILKSAPSGSRRGPASPTSRSAPASTPGWRRSCPASTPTRRRPAARSRS